MSGLPDRRGDHTFTDDNRHLLLTWCAIQSGERPGPGSVEAEIFRHKNARELKVSEKFSSPEMKGEGGGISKIYRIFKCKKFVKRRGEAMPPGNTENPLRFLVLLCSGSGKKQGRHPFFNKNVVT